jgi:hypothetical protein
MVRLVRRVLTVQRYCAPGAPGTEGAAGVGGVRVLEVRLILNARSGAPDDRQGAKGAFAA